MRADCLPRARVSVVVDGVTLAEHGTENSDGVGATTFIEAVPGAEFMVRLDIEPKFAYRNPNDRINFITFLDGERANATLLFTDHLPIVSKANGVYEVKNGETTIRPFMFAEHSTCMFTLAGTPYMC